MVQLSFIVRRMVDSYAYRQTVTISMVPPETRNIRALLDFVWVLLVSLTLTKAISLWLP
jgi:hypothetical protein